MNESSQDYYDLDLGHYLNYLRDSGKKPYPFILISGRRGLGKSFLARDIVSYFRDYEKVLCFCGSEMANGDWRGDCDACDGELGASAHHTCRFPPGTIHPTYNPTVMGRVVDAHKKEFEKKGDACGRLLIVLDDISMDADILNKCKTLKLVAVMGRHFKITCLIITQFIYDMQPKLRRQATMFFTLGETDDAVVKALKREFFSCIGTEKVVQKVMTVLTDDFGCMVKVDTSSKAVKDMVFRYKAKNRGHYTVGSHEFRCWVIRHTLTQRERNRRDGIDVADMKKGQIRVRVHDKTGKIYLDKAT
jgi:hypothetical protein